MLQFLWVVVTSAGAQLDAHWLLRVIHLVACQSGAWVTGGGRFIWCPLW